MIMLNNGCPNPGIYPDVSFEEYLSWSAVSNSSLHFARRSMAHYNCRAPIEETPAMKLGTLCHAGHFEPLQLAKRYAVMPAYELTVRKPDGSEYDKPKASAAYRELCQEFREANVGKIIVEQSEFDRMIGVCSSLKANTRAAEYLSGPRMMFEVAIVWIDEETGILCKGRTDALDRECLRINDLKTSQDIEDFQRSIFNRSYHRQGAFYCDGIKTLTGDEFTFTLTAVETNKPFGVRSAPLSKSAIELGRQEYRELLRQIAACEISKSWPGYESPDEWQLPGWAMPDTMSVDDGVLTSW